MRQAFGEAVLALMRQNPKVVILNADCQGMFFLGDATKEFPKRSFEVGIAEQNLIGIAAGMASTGLMPYAVGLAPFVSMRACEQVRTDCGYTNFNVKMGVMYGGLTQPVGGSTHHATEDLSILRAMPNITVIAPADALETYKAVIAAAERPGPVYIRLGGRDPEPVVYQEDYKFEIGKAVTLREGRDLTIVGTGGMTLFALWGAEMLAAEGIQARVLDLHTIKPIDEEAIVKAAKETGRIMTIEEHNVYGGLGGAVAEVVVQKYPVPMKFIGIEDLYASVGPLYPLRAKYGLSAENVAAQAKAFLAQK
jgi:transketolase